MALHSRMLSGNAALEKAAVGNTDHITPGARGDHVGRLQQVLMLLDRTTIAASELDAQLYGPSTAKAVLAYKTKRGIINRSYQTTADNIVGVMTMASLDKEMSLREASIVSQTLRCNFGGKDSPFVA